ncbi:hypothetical protein BJ165DRAFT_1452055 [Panaeolus papilionaceus]|nr:hypothetical protein BJ165DRAFT_1452055 [Panaeolus papilionaceus]
MSDPNSGHGTPSCSQQKSRATESLSHINIDSLSPQQQVNLAHHLLSVNTPLPLPSSLSLAPLVSTSTVCLSSLHLPRNFTDDLPTAPPYTRLGTSSFLDVPKNSQTSSISSGSPEIYHSITSSPGLLLSSSCSLTTGCVLPPPFPLTRSGGLFDVAVPQADAK